MTKDEALKLALDALETSMYPQQKQLQAITAIKKALAQPEQEPVAWMHAMDNTEGHKANKPYVLFTKSKRNPFGVAGRDYSKSYPVTKQPLYTTPPQRKPLSEEEIGAILEDVNAYGTRLYTFARAIEAAHGIKENT